LGGYPKKQWGGDKAVEKRTVQFGKVWVCGFPIQNLRGRKGWGEETQNHWKSFYNKTEKVSQKGPQNSTEKKRGSLKRGLKRRVQRQPPKNPLVCWVVAKSGRKAKKPTHADRKRGKRGKEKQGGKVKVSSSLATSSVEKMVNERGDLKGSRVSGARKGGIVWCKKYRSSEGLIAPGSTYAGKGSQGGKEKAWWLGQSQGEKGGMERKRRKSETPVYLKTCESWDQGKKGQRKEKPEKRAGQLGEWGRGKLLLNYEKKRNHRVK